MFSWKVVPGHAVLIPESLTASPPSDFNNPFPGRKHIIPPLLGGLVAAPAPARSQLDFKAEVVRQPSMQDCLPPAEISPSLAAMFNQVGG